MSIFRRDPEPQNPVPSPVQPSPAPSRSPAPSGAAAPNTAKSATHIAAGTKVVGQISGNTELVIDGRVEGEISLESRVVVGASGHVKGEIQARAVQVGGRVDGNVRGLERVEVLSSGGLEGDVVSPRVVIAEGAFFKGKVEMTDQKVASKPVAPVSAGGGKPATPNAGNQGGGGQAGPHQGGPTQGGPHQGGGKGGPQHAQATRDGR